MDSPLRTFRAGAAWVSRTQWFRRNGLRFMPGFERLMRRLTGGRVTASGILMPEDEREKVWATIQRQWPGYRKYEAASGRTLRIFRLTRR